MPPPFDVQLQLQQHGGALRRLALELLRDDADADDALQETWRRALTKPPRHHERVGGWLVVMLRNVAFRLRRAQARRRRHEDGAAAVAPVVAEDPAISTARAELAHRLIAAVDALEQPFRDAIWQRFFEGRAPREIAVAGHLPVSTVKSRLQRGLAMLRERLGERDGVDWRAGFAAAFGFGKEGTATTATAASAAAGGVLMATWVKVTAACAAAAAAIAAMTWWPDAAPAAPAASARDRASIVASAPATGESTVVPPSSTGPERTAVAAGSAVDPMLATVRGRCVDETGNPIAGCTARLFGRVGEVQAAEEWFFAGGEDRLELKTSTSADGRFEFSFAPPPPFHFHLFVQGEAWARRDRSWSGIERGAVVEVGDLTMQPAVMVRGRIVDTAGLPVPEVLLRLRRSPGDMQHTASSRADGTFAFSTAVPHGKYSLRVSDDYAVQSPVPLVVAANPPAGGMLVVVSRPDTPTITGTVVDEADQPLQFATVTWRQGADLVNDGVYSRRDGSFSLRCTGGNASEPVRIDATLHGFEGAPHDVRWGARDVRVRIVRAAGLTVFARDDAGKPLEGCAIVVRSADTTQWESVAKGRTGADGMATIRGISRGEYFAVARVASAPPLQPSIQRVVIDGSPVQLELRFGSLPSRRLRVQRNDGTPVACTRVQLCELLGNTFDRPCQVLAPGNWFGNASSPRILVLAEVVTDASGIATVQGPAGRELGLRVLGPGHIPVEQSNLRVDVAGDHVVAVAVGARVHGKLVPPEAIEELRRLAGTVEEGFPPDDRRPRICLRRANTLLPGHRALPAEQERFVVDADGSFDIDGLPAGQWQIVLRYIASSESMRMSRDVALATCTLVDGESTSIVGDVTHLLPGTFRALVRRNGEPWPNAMIVVEASHGIGADGKEVREFMSVTTDADARFEYTGRPGRYWVRRGDKQDAIASPIIELTRGVTVPVTFEFGAAVLNVRVLAPDGSPASGLGMYGSGPWPIASTDAEGRASITNEPGTLLLRVPPRRLQEEQLHRPAARPGADPLTGQWIDLGEVTFVASRTTTVELRLPPQWEK